MIETLVFLILFFGLGYAFLLGVLHLLWKRIPEADLFYSLEPDFLSVSVVIAARNEGKNIVECLSSIIKNDFPTSHYEVLVIDDNSSDDTFGNATSIHHPNINCLKNPSEGKKSALAFGIEKASHEIILCTDADCVVPHNWIKSHSVFYKKYPEKLACVGLVLPKTEDTSITKFQWLDFAATMVMTLVGHRYYGVFLGNGAHLSYRKSAFYEVNGYIADYHVASGDDIFLIKKLATKFPNSIGYIKDKNTVIETKPETSWSQLWQQRKRWATKTSQVRDIKVAAFQGWIFLFVLCCAVSIILSFLLSNFSLFIWGIIGLIIKFLVDYYFLKSLSKYFQKPMVLSGFMKSSIVYIYHILQSGYFVLRPSKYTWKGREVD